MNGVASLYDTLAKPFFAPPAWVFAPVWSILYIIIAITFIRIFYLAFKRIIPGKAAVPFVLNIIFNLAFMPLQFTVQNNYLAALDVVLVLGTLVWGMIDIWAYSRKLAYWQIPYLLWVLFATALQLTIAVMNRQ